MNSLIICLLLSLTTVSSDFFIPTLKANWFQANEFCNSIEMKLASVPNKTVHDELVNFMKQSDKFSYKGRYWLGASDLGENGTYTWVANGRMMTFNNWQQNRPNYTDPFNRCLEIAHWPSAGWNWTWDNSNCYDQKFYFVCEKGIKQNCIEEF
uniref:Uncharacterized protein n=1 Tax=Aedes aegypti TaxID=7159 RepID=A0A6E8PJ29_AEDAE|nr:uncharacterized protein LOC125480933 precursor [Aedes aegypti]